MNNNSVYPEQRLNRKERRKNKAIKAKFKKHTIKRFKQYVKQKEEGEV